MKVICVEGTSGFTDKGLQKDVYRITLNHDEFERVGHEMIVEARKMLSAQARNDGVMLTHFNDYVIEVPVEREEPEPEQEEE